MDIWNSCITWINCWFTFVFDMEDEFLRDLSSIFHDLGDWISAGVVFLILFIILSTPPTKHPLQDLPEEKVKDV